jgi:hypothetical protein
MEPGESDDHLTRVKGQHPDIFPSSPNALLAVFVAVLQSRFYAPVDPGDLPWVWTGDPIPDDDDSGSLPGDTAEERRAPRRIYITSAFNEYPSARNLKPALLVGRAAIQYVRLGVGNRAAHDFPRGGEVLVCHAMTNITVNCVSREDGESATLADVVASFFLGSAPEIRAEFGIHGIEPPVISETTVYRRSGANVESWGTTVSLPIEVQYKWWRYPLAPVIREFAARLRINGEATDLREVLQR